MSYCMYYIYQSKDVTSMHNVRQTFSSAYLGHKDFSPIQETFTPPSPKIYIASSTGVGFKVEDSSLLQCDAL